jgi:transposase, IS30 family
MRSWGLSADEQDEVWQRWRRGESLRLIAQRLGRVPSTVSREVARNGGRRCYRAQTADGQPTGRRGGPRRPN